MENFTIHEMIQAQLDDALRRQHGGGHAKQQLPPQFVHNLALAIQSQLAASQSLPRSSSNASMSSVVQTLNSPSPNLSRSRSNASFSPSPNLPRSCSNASFSPSPNLSLSQSNVPFSPSPNLSRSSSNASFSASTNLSRSSSNSSACMNESTTCTESDSESTVSKSRKRKRMSRKKKRKRRRQQRRRRQDNLSKDKKAVNNELMAIIDKQFLAPFTSSMFYRKLKKSSSAGVQILKQNEDIDLSLFKSVTRHLRARLCSRDLNRLREQDPTLRPDTLNDRYEEAMLALARKRRANHMQSWRVYKTHCRLIYSPGATDTEFQRLHAGFHQRDPAQAPAQAPAPPPPPPVQSAHDVADDELTEPDFDLVDPEDSPRPESQVDPEVSRPPVPETRDSPRPDEEESQVDPEVSLPPVPETHNPRPPVSMHRIISKCSSCGAFISHNSAFPQDKQKDWVTKTPLRCEKCWKAHVEDELIPNIAQDVARAKKQKQFARKTKRKKDANGEQQKRKKRTQCRCGSKSHVSIRHHSCPLNKKNKDKEGDFFACVSELPTCCVGGYFCHTCCNSTRSVSRAATTRTASPVASPDIHSSPPPAANVPSSPPPAADVPSSPPPVADVPSSPPPAADVPSSPPTPPLTRFVPRVGSNVLVRFKRNEWYLAHITKKVNDTTFDVYFPEDSKAKKSVPLVNIRPIQKNCTEPTRGQLIGKVFNDPGDEDVPPGRWTVRRLKGEENIYVCTSCDPDATVNCVDYDVGFVVSCYKNDLQRKYENPFLTL